MLSVEKTYDGNESPQWREELVELLSGVAYDYLKGEGLLREEALAEKTKTAIREARSLAERGEGWEEPGENIPFPLKEAKVC